MLLSLEQLKITNILTAGIITVMASNHISTHKSQKHKKIPNIHGKYLIFLN